MEEDRMPKKIFTGRDETKRKTQERMERRSGKRSSSAGSEKTERVGDRYGKMERYCSTGQSLQRVVAPTEEVQIIKSPHYVVFSTSLLLKGAVCKSKNCFIICFCEVFKWVEILPVKTLIFLVNCKLHVFTISVEWRQAI
jgi:hypothetical protein